VAIARSQRALSCVPAELEPHYVDAPWEGIELIDSPDIDGALREHRTLTQQLIDQCDVVVYVTSPDKRANFDVHEEVRLWASRKRWVFVLNKVDQEEPRLRAIRADFEARLRDLGFTTCDSSVAFFQRRRELNPGGLLHSPPSWKGVAGEGESAARVFLVSATNPNLFDFAEFRINLLDPRQAHAVETDLVAPLKQLAERVSQRERECTNRVRDLYRRALADPMVEDAFRRAVREQTWVGVGERLGGPMGLTVWMRHLRL
jgi:hypothetical protein